MIHLAVGSTNPVKISSATTGIAKAMGNVVECEGFVVKSTVPDQPIGEAETMRGAKSRALNSWKAFTEKNGKAPDYSIGLEGGVTMTTTMDCFACICIYDGKCYGTSKTASFPLPHAISKLVKEGFELGDADDKVFNTVNNKQAGGTVGVLTKGVIPRAAYYEHAVILAFARFNFPDLYADEP